ncbi:hypothetical protein TOT_020000739 [Theileria orientalis strain Shintoku]|uniref:Uncharacterized protein n=1 Tax=Theileria orientalis strain Shintoku TaxID=869250 RepID=J4C8B2_THEOR|nr:hypothetical protein TOT_020000739 [Theileria orientalis strain Shintoku]PVC51245.1 hypothetical protein MACL_00001682 [Theileria orientalis]BAM40483.1 hypothetical protein TOT_020000739 [Theileria orientalis strain Shintoku]|eukprot:XP_009690784.1 hypothetical protein TOT_020000739 [Theileria orientalis strain Shintoku]
MTGLAVESRIGVNTYPCFSPVSHYLHFTHQYALRINIIYTATNGL